MDISKYSTPKLPAPQFVLDDLADPNIKSDHVLKITEGDITVQDSHTCYTYFKELQEDLLEHRKLNSKLADLNKKLLEKIESMKIN